MDKKIYYKINPRTENVNEKLVNLKSKITKYLLQTKKQMQRILYKNRIPLHLFFLFKRI